jgi:transcription initiation factor TFIIE subunit alpha
MTSNQLESIIQYLTDETTVQVIQILLKKTEVTDEQIVNTLNESIDLETPEDENSQRISLKEVRRSLYKLNEQSLARYRRVRDKETGYFVYHWSPIWERIKDLIIRRRKQSIKKLKQRLDYEERNLLYICESDHAPVTFSDAFEMGFVCSTCGEPLAQKENENTINFLKEKISFLEERLYEGLDKSLT